MQNSMGFSIGSMIERIESGERVYPHVNRCKFQFSPFEEELIKLVPDPEHLAQRNERLKQNKKILKDLAALKKSSKRSRSKQAVPASLYKDKETFFGVQMPEAHGSNKVRVIYEKAHGST